MCQPKNLLIKAELVFGLGIAAASFYRNAEPAEAVR